MEISKITEVFATTSDGKKLKDGTKVVYQLTDGTCGCGVFKGINKRNNLEFDSLIVSDSTTSIMPKSIEKLFIATIDIQED